MSKKNLINELSGAIATLNQALSDELTKEVIAGNINDMVETTPADLSSRYWLMQFLEPLTRKELKSVVDGFLVQLLNEEQARKLVKFLLVRFPNYYEESMDTLQKDDSADLELKELGQKERYPSEKFEEIQEVDLEKN
jgi:hypothetical protein